MIKVTRKGLQGADEALTTALQRDFTAHQCVILPRLIEDEVFQKIAAGAKSAPFVENEHQGQDKTVFAADLSIVGSNVALHQINFLMNNPAIFRLIEAITGCSTVQGFTARIYRNMPGANHYLDWHDDTIDKHRLIGISMNLGLEKFEGGVFQIRRKGSEELLREVSCGNPGDTHVFKVSPDLQHRVTKTIGDHPRTVAAGWFMDNKSAPLFKL
jgi:hypothetical protein